MTTKKEGADFNGDYDEVLGSKSSDKDTDDLLGELERVMDEGEQGELEPVLDNLIRLGKEKKIAFGVTEKVRDVEHPEDLLFQLIDLKIDFLKLSRGVTRILKVIDRTTEQGLRVYNKIIDYVKEVGLFTDADMEKFLSKYGS